MKKNENYDVGCCFYIMKRLFLGILLVFFFHFQWAGAKERGASYLGCKGELVAAGV